MSQFDRDVITLTSSLVSRLLTGKDQVAPIRKVQPDWLRLFNMKLPLVKSFMKKIKNGYKPSASELIALGV